MVQVHQEMHKLEQDQQEQEQQGQEQQEFPKEEGREATPETALACLGWPLPVI